MIVALTLTFLAHLFDYITTKAARAKGFRELNPFVEWIGLLPTKIIGVGISWGLQIAFHQILWLVTLVIVGFYVVVGMWNWHLATRFND